MVCADKDCEKTLEPYCSVCLELNTHKKKHIFEKNLRSALVELQDDVINCNKEIEKENESASEW